MLCYIMLCYIDVLRIQRHNCHHLLQVISPNYLLLFIFIYLILFFRQDFFLISQTVNQGTVGPTHYIVVKNDITILSNNPVHLHTLTFKLCHLYYNWQVSNVCKHTIYNAVFNLLDYASSTQETCIKHFLFILSHSLRNN